MHLNSIQSRGIFLLTFAMLFVFALLAFVLIQNQIRDVNSETQTNFIIVNSLKSDEEIFYNNLEFIVDKTINKFANRGVLDRSEILEGLNIVVQDYLIKGGFEIQDDFTNNNNLLLELSGYERGNATYIYSINSKVSKEINLNGSKYSFFLPEGYSVGGSIAK